MDALIKKSRRFRYNRVKDEELNHDEDYSWGDNEGLNNSGVNSEHLGASESNSEVNSLSNLSVCDYGQSLEQKVTDTEVV